MWSLSFVRKGPWRKSGRCWIRLGRQSSQDLPEPCRGASASRRCEPRPHTRVQKSITVQYLVLVLGKAVLAIRKCNRYHWPRGLAFHPRFVKTATTLGDNDNRPIGRRLTWLAKAAGRRGVHACRRPAFFFRRRSSLGWLLDRIHGLTGQLGFGTDVRHARKPHTWRRPRFDHVP